MWLASEVGTLGYEKLWSFLVSALTLDSVRISLKSWTLSQWWVEKLWKTPYIWCQKRCQNEDSTGTIKGTQENELRSKHYTSFFSDCFFKGPKLIFWLMSILILTRGGTSILGIVSICLPDALIKDPDKRNFKKNLFILAHNWRKQSIMAETWGSWSHCTHNQEAEKHESLRSAPFLHLHSSGSQAGNAYWARFPLKEINRHNQRPISKLILDSVNLQH